MPCRGIRARPVGRQGLIGDGIGHGVRHQGLQRAVKGAVHALERAVQRCCRTVSAAFLRRRCNTAPPVRSAPCRARDACRCYTARNQAGMAASAGTARASTTASARTTARILLFMMYLLLFFGFSHHITRGTKYATRICIRPAPEVSQLHCTGRTCYNHGIET